jgi:hypothetical protein
MRRAQRFNDIATGTTKMLQEDDNARAAKQL